MAIVDREGNRSDPFVMQNEVASTVETGEACNNVTTIWFDEVLANEPVESVRLDRCCHLNTRGLHMIGDSIQEAVQPLLNR